MEINDKKIAHLKNIGATKEDAFKNLEEKLFNSGVNSLEIAEIIDSVKVRDGGIPNKRVGYIAGIYGSRMAENEFDPGEDVYHIIYLKGAFAKEGSLWKYGGQVDIVDLQNVTNYIPKK